MTKIRNLIKTDKDDGTFLLVFRMIVKEETDFLTNRIINEERIRW